MERNGRKRFGRRTGFGILLASSAILLLAVSCSYFFPRPAASQYGSLKLTAVYTGPAASAPGRSVAYSLVPAAGSARGRGVTQFPTGVSLDPADFSYEAVFVCNSSPISPLPTLSSVTSGSGDFVIASVPVGDWQVTVTVTSGGTTVAIGSTPFTVTDGGEATPTVYVDTPTGQGPFNLNLTWPDNGTAIDPEATITGLHPVSGPQPITLDPALATGTVGTIDLDAGSYVLQLSLKAPDGVHLCWGDFYSILILPGATTTLTESLGISDINTAPPVPLLSLAWTFDGSDYSIQASWTGSGADNFDLYKYESLDGNFETPTIFLPNLPGSTFGHTDSAVDPSRWYLYRLVAKNAYGENASSDGTINPALGSLSQGTTDNVPQAAAVSISGPAAFSSGSATWTANFGGASSSLGYEWLLDGLSVASGSSSYTGGASWSVGVHFLTSKVTADGVYAYSGTKKVTKNLTSQPLPGLGLVGEWLFSGGDASDTSGNGHIGTTMGTVGSVPDRFGHANSAIGIALSGAGYVDCGNPADDSLDLGTDATFIVWANPSVLTEGVLIGKDSGSGALDKWFFEYDTNRLRFHLNTPLNPDHWLISNPLDIRSGAWQQFAVVKQGTDYLFYYNGETAGMASSGVVVPPVDFSLEIGKAEDMYFGSGAIDDVRVYNRALNSAEILEIYGEGGWTGYPAPLVDMTRVVGGAFQMGSDDNADEQPIHQAVVSSFYIGKYEVTQGQYLAVMGNNPSSHTGDDNLPVERVTWYDAVMFCNLLSAREGYATVYTITNIWQTDGTLPTAITSAIVTADFGANGYRLPSEAEWEYAARGGNQSQGYAYAGADAIDGVAWYMGTPSTQIVGTKASNELGLQDMSGNVGEWCWDWSDAYSSDSQVNPLGPPAGTYRVVRGGNWIAADYTCTVTFRGDYGLPEVYDAYHGFRVVRNAP